MWGILIKPFHQLVIKRVRTCCPKLPPVALSHQPISTLSAQVCWWTSHQLLKPPQPQHHHSLTLIQSVPDLAAKKAAPAYVWRRREDSAVWLHWYKTQRSIREEFPPLHSSPSRWRWQTTHLLASCLFSWLKRAMRLGGRSSRSRERKDAPPCSK